MTVSEKWSLRTAGRQHSNEIHVSFAAFPIQFKEIQRTCGKDQMRTYSQENSRPPQ